MDNNIPTLTSVCLVQNVLLIVLAQKYVWIATFVRWHASTTQIVIPFTKDGPGGPDDPTLSGQIIIDWLKTGDNFQRWAGNNSQGKKKIQFATELCALMRAAGCLQEQNPKDVN